MADQVSAHIDHEAQAVYVSLAGCSAVARTVERDEGNFDLDRDGNVVGFEILHVPAMLQVAPVAAELGFAHLLDRIYRAYNNAYGIQVGEPGRLTVAEAWA